MPAEASVSVLGYHPDGGVWAGTSGDDIVGIGRIIRVQVDRDRFLSRLG